MITVNFYLFIVLERLLSNIESWKIIMCYLKLVNVRKSNFLMAIVDLVIVICQPLSLFCERELSLFCERELLSWKVIWLVIWGCFFIYFICIDLQKYVFFTEVGLQNEAILAKKGSTFYLRLLATLGRALHRQWRGEGGVRPNI